MELKTARLTILIDPAKKQAFEELCRTQDMTPSQVVRRLIREFMEQEQAEAAERRSARKSGTARKSR
jgi:predicted transcriptional regulator